jgi:SAM-dependent methyltransferase
MSLAFHLGLLHDERRLATWAEAIERAVASDDIVIDLGAGFGALSIFAARRGARVFAVEREEAGGHIATFAAHHGVADRVTVLRGDSTTLDPPARASLAFFDDVDVLDLGGSAVRTLADARARWLRDDARLLPTEISLHVALAHADVALPDAVAGLDTTGLGAVRLGPQKRKLSDDTGLLSEPVEVARGGTDALGANGLSLAASITAARPGAVAGLLLWPRLHLEGVTLDAGPHPTPIAYPQIFFPWATAFPVVAGQICDVRLRQTRSSATAGEHRLWRWEATCGEHSAGGSTFAAGGLDAIVAAARGR